MNRIVVAALFLGACSSSTPAPKLAPLDLSAAGLNMTLDAAEGSVASADKVGSTFMGVLITASSPKGYALHVSEITADIARDKQDCLGAVHKNCEVISEAPDAIVTKWKQLGKDNYVVDVAVGPKLSCKTATLEAHIESKAVADSVLVSCRSLKRK